MKNNREVQALLAKFACWNEPIQLLGSTKILDSRCLTDFLGFEFL